jgi:TonB family protein
VRCSECQTAPLTKGHYCECCGRKLSEQELQSLVVAADTSNQLALDFTAGVEARCGSCGGPTAGSDLCPACEQAFSSVLGSLNSAAPAAEPVDAALTSPVPAIDFEALLSTEAPSSASPEDSVASVESAHAVAAIAALESLAALEPVASVDPEPSHAQPVVAASDVHVPAPVMPVAAIAAASAAPVAAVAAPAPASRNRSALVAVAAVVIVTVIGVPAGALWLRNQLPQSAPAPAPAASVAKKDAVVAHPPTPAPPPAAVEPEPAPAPIATPPPAQAAVTPRAPRPKAPAKAVKPAAPSLPPAPLVAPTEMTAAPAPVAALAPAPPPVQPRMVMPEPPAGHLFEPNEVDEMPKIATRVEPQLPGNLSRSANDVVVVRMLVSQTGHPFRVSLLRRSRSGASVDDAVVAAVKQWTFSPARKRGETVSCWFNFGVSLAN